jgi:hypothetical protein
VVLVSQDGIQRSPFRFPKGGHLLQFLSCLENGLLPHGQLDPPLWSQRGKVSGPGVLGRLRWGPALGSGPRPSAVQVPGTAVPGDLALGLGLSGQSISQTAQAKPSGLLRVHVFRQGGR